jgi:hypothetical protein
VNRQPARWTTVLSIALVVGAAAVIMYLVTTFLFHFSSGQYRMGSVVDLGALLIVLGTLVLAAIVWRVRSPAAAVRWTAIATGVAWVAALVIEWGLSFAYGA